MAGELPSMRAVVLQFTDSAPCVCHSVCVCKCLIGGKLTSELDLQKK